MELTDAACRVLTGLLESRTGQRLTMNRRWRFETTLGALMRERGVTSLDALISKMLTGGDPGLADSIVEALLNNETFFFRDRSAFDLLLGGALDRVEQARAGKKKLSIWSAGCSTGQEAYSLAMAFAEAETRWQGWTISILGSDISASAIARAREGSYTQLEIQRGLPVAQMMRWFSKEAISDWRIAPELRRSVRFQVHSLMEPPPGPGRFDIILCRNVLLYLTPENRQRVFSRLAEAAAPDACLMLGAGETVIGQTEAFVSDPISRGFYTHSKAAAPVTRLRYAEANRRS